ncbi:MAG: hypothetical protein GY774_36920 [Planctomycetes bacterium]|nr:hypothetical protein [Planctomycetota bacterium]
MYKKHFYTAVILLSFLVIGIQPVIAINIPIDTSVGSWDLQTRTYTLTQPVAVTLNIVEDNLTLDGGGFTVNWESGPQLYGVDLLERLDVTIENLIVTGFDSGISLRLSNNCTVTENSVSTCDYGIWLAGSSNNTVTNNTVNSSINAGIWLQRGFLVPPGLWVGSNDNTLTSNTTMNSQNGYGIYIQLSNNNSLTYNDASNNKYGIKIVSSAGGNTLENNTVSYNTGTGNTGHGIWINGSSTPAEPTSTLNYNQVFNNNGHGIKLVSSDDYIVTNNTISYNGGGIRVENAINNKIYHNNFIESTFFQASMDGDTTGNVFNLDLPTGGNFWSDYVGADNDGDGIGDTGILPHLGLDNYPFINENGWITPTPTPQDEIVELIFTVAEMNLHQGIENSLDAKLDTAFNALDDMNENNDGAAINSLNAFINAVEAQRGNKITNEQANILVADANAIITLLGG